MGVPASTNNQDSSSNVCQSFLFVCFVFLFFRGRLSLYSPGCPGPPFVDQAGLKLRNLPASAFQVMGLNVCVNKVSILLLAQQTLYIICYAGHSLFVCLFVCFSRQGFSV